MSEEIDCDTLITNQYEIFDLMKKQLANFKKGSARKKNGNLFQKTAIHNRKILRYFPF